MQITLLPPLLPSESVVPVGARQVFTAGQRLLATVTGTGLEGGTSLLFGGQEMRAGGTLPYPPGTTLRLEVVEGGPQPLLRLVSVEAEALTERTDGEVPAPAGPPVSSATYGLAAAVFAAHGAADVRDAATAFARWLPALVAAGVLTATQGEALARALGPVPVPAGRADDPRGGASEAVGGAIAERVSEGGLLLERRLADVVRQGSAAARAAAASDLRSRLAVAAHLIELAPSAFGDARQAVRDLQEALLAEQARAAAHLAHDGVVDVRVPLQVADREAEMRLRMRIEKEAPGCRDDADPFPWRQVRLDLDLDGLGRVQVTVGVAAAQVRAEFFVEHPDAADRIEAGLVDLDLALERAGFAEVLARVAVDPVRVCAPDTLPELPSQRRILDTRA